MAISLADVKAEMRLSHNFEDTLITRKLAAATDYVEEAIGRKLAEIDGGAPPALEEAIIALTCHLVEWRGVATEAALTLIPSGYADLLRTFRYGRFPDGE